MSPTTKSGEKITWSEFFKRWGKGIEGLTPQQKLKSQVVGTRISLIGLFLGLFVTIYGYKNLWWVAIILVGAIINTGVQYISQRQQLKVFEDIEKELEGGII